MSKSARLVTKRKREMARRCCYLISPSGNSPQDCKVSPISHTSKAPGWESSHQTTANTYLVSSHLAKISILDQDLGNHSPGRN